MRLRLPVHAFAALLSSLVLSPHIARSAEEVRAAHHESVLPPANLAAHSPTWAGVADGPGNAWSQVPTPAGRMGHCAIYDPVRQRMLVFGGSIEPYRKGGTDVWALTLDGTQPWSRLFPTGLGPTYGYHCSAIYDPIRDRMVVYSSGSIYALSLSGAPAWTKLEPTGTVPSGRNSQLAVYDTARDRMIIYGGGYAPSGGYSWRILQDAWALSFADLTWAKLSDGGPALGGGPGEVNQSAIYDPARDRMLVFSPSSGVWSLALSGTSTWTTLTTTSKPGVGVYDASADQVVMTAPDDTTWTFPLTGTPAWNLLTVSGTAPTSRRDYTVVLDAPRHRTVMYGGGCTSSSCGGYTTMGGPGSGEVWSMPVGTAPAWTKLMPSNDPPSTRSTHTAIYDPIGDRMVVFGGAHDDWYGESLVEWMTLSSGGFLAFGGSPSWTYTGDSQPRFSHSAVFDPVRDRMLIFGGHYYQAGYADRDLNDVRALSLGASPAWSLITPTGTPPTPRSRHSAIYDPIRDRMLVFGGDVDNAVWSLALSGTPTWAQLSPTGTPPPATGTAIYDVTRDRMLVFGGASGVWTLSLGAGPTWSQIGTFGTGPGSGFPVYDPLRDRMIVVTKPDSVFALTLAGSATWTQLPTPLPMPCQWPGPAIYDAARDRILVFGGDGASGRTSETWAYQLESATWSACATAAQIVGFMPGSGTASSSAANMLGAPDGVPVALGLGGSVTLRMDHEVVDGPGNDLYITEDGAALGMGDEDYRVEVSPDGIAFTRLGDAPGGSRGFDLASAAISLARYVRITDLPPDPSSAPPAVGAAIDAVSALHCGAAIGVVAPSGLSAVATPCSDRVHLAWSDNSPDESAFEIQGKPQGFSDDWYRSLVSPPAGSSSTDYSPSGGSLSGLAVTYRVRALRGPEASAFSNEASAEAGLAAARPPAPASVSVKSVGDGGALRIRVTPPSQMTDWSAVSEIDVQIADNSGFAGATTVVLSRPSSAGELVYDGFRGLRGNAYWVQACTKTCELMSPWTRAPRGVAPTVRPILFIHGIWSDGTVWNKSQWTTDFDVVGLTRRFIMSFKCSGDTWYQWTKELGAYCDREFADTGDWRDDEDIDIVAWSQGGLAARAYIEVRQDQARVHSLFMLGTPNHGGEFSTLQSWLHNTKRYALPCDQTGHGDGASYLITKSQGLLWLNFGDDGASVADGKCQDAPVESRVASRKATAYYSVAGTGGCWGIALGLLCTIRDAWVPGSVGSCDGDGVVPWKSVRLRAMSAAGSSCYQWLDTDVPGEPQRYVHHPGVQDSDLSPTTIPMLDSQHLADFVARVLKNGPPADHGSSCQTSAVPARLMRVQDDGSPILISSHADSVSSGETRTQTVAVDSSSKLIVFVSSETSPLDIQLVMPDSTVLSPADTSHVSWLAYARDDSLTFAAFTVTNPAAGNWKVRVTGLTGHPLEQYGTSWVLEGGSYHLIAGTSTDEASAGDAVRITASLQGSAQPLAASCSATVQGPGSSQWVVPMNDNGVDGDAVAGDGVYTGRFVAPSQDGGYTALVSASASGGSIAVSRSAALTFTVLSRPELEVRSAAITWSPSIPLKGQPASLQARLFNLGNAACDSAELIFYDRSTGDSIATRYAIVAPGDSVLVNVPWSPSAVGSHEIDVTAVSLNQPEGNLANNFAAETVPVGGSPDNTGISGRPRLPSQFQMALPRPNPSRGEVTFDFAVPRTARVAITVYDVAGRVVSRAVDGTFVPGWHSVVWSRRGQSGQIVPAGVYFVRLVTPGVGFVRRTVLVQ